MISIKKYVMNFSLMIIISILFTQNLDLFTQKITLENSLRDKIYSELERVLNKNKNRFVVVVNLELGKYGDLISQNQNNNKGNQNARGMEYLPGVPLSGSKGISQNDNTTQRRIGANDYIISEIDISIYIEQSLATGANEKMIESLVKGIIPQTSGCDDCVTIETMNFQTPNNEDTELAKLRRELEEFKEADRKRQMTELNVQLADLQARLEDSENERMTWEDYERKRDSVKVAHWEQAKAEEEILLKEQLLAKCFDSQCQFQVLDSKESRGVGSIERDSVFQPGGSTILSAENIFENNIQPSASPTHSHAALSQTQADPSYYNT